MSYEGYEVIYCVCGYRKGSHDAYDFAREDEERNPCPICGSTAIRIDGVDETNGCYCDELEDGARCPAHEQITEEDIIKYVPVPCPTCCGSGVQHLAAYPSIKDCRCGGSKTDPTKTNCVRCFGTGYVYEPCFDHDVADVVCPECKGRKLIFKPLYNLSKLGGHD